ncbi:DUF6893 family small protein [Amycolatopsis acidiphila]
MVIRGLLVVSLIGLVVLLVRTVGPDVRRYARISRM